MTQTITIRLADESNPEGVPFEIEAHVFGVWAAHRAVMPPCVISTDQWVVTHIPTGRCAGESMSDDETRVSAAAKRLGDAFPIQTLAEIKVVRGGILDILDEEGLL